MIKTLFMAMGGPAAVGRVLGISTEHAAGMAKRQSIPLIYWPKLIAEARRRRLELTYESLAHMHIMVDRPRKSRRLRPEATP